MSKPCIIGNPFFLRAIFANKQISAIGNRNSRLICQRKLLIKSRNNQR
ncbi:hypothetical protein PCL1391_5733 [Pseudomonas chlororaphis subsp. piscium]|uniref:Uncharacterized protein n=1 Tax=Pseudomonas chlororaphis TaxID=587753 RepID=A0AAX3FX42_9PSED|nr:hypothetical protein PCL1391_5733 [Pseudomonas chlororaphis subsp. piscium]VEF75250.1 Uncharacterised protein [Pseudomonas chlororaphis]